MIISKATHQMDNLSIFISKLIMIVKGTLKMGNFYIFLSKLIMILTKYTLIYGNYEHLILLLRLFSKAIFYYSACILLHKNLVSGKSFTIETFFTIHFLLYPRYTVHRWCILSIPFIIFIISINFQFSVYM